MDPAATLDLPLLKLKFATTLQCPAHIPLDEWIIPVAKATWMACANLSRDNWTSSLCIGIFFCWTSLVKFCTILLMLSTVIISGHLIYLSLANSACANSIDCKMPRNNLENISRVLVIFDLVGSSNGFPVSIGTPVWALNKGAMTQQCTSPAMGPLFDRYKMSGWVCCLTGV